MITDYTLEVRKRVASTSGGKTSVAYNYMGGLDKRIQPAITRELGLADVLTFNLQLTDPKYQLFVKNPANLEIWYYGRDKLLKQIFVPQILEPYRDYGGSASGSGATTLGSGSGDNVAIAADGPETYLTRYYTQEYTATQRSVNDILNDICAELAVDGYLTAVYVDVNLDQIIDIDLSWENIKTAVDNVINQVGGYMRVMLDPDDPTYRVLCVLPIPGALPQPGTVEASSGILPQAKRPGRIFKKRALHDSRRVVEKRRKLGISLPSSEPFNANKPTMTIGKNLNGIDVMRDTSGLITRLYVRGSGSPPSELTLNNPPYYPVEQNLDHVNSDGVWAYFNLPNSNPYSVYDGFTKDGDPLPSGFYVGKGLTTWTLPPSNDNTYVQKLGMNSAAAQVFYMSQSFRIYWVALQLIRKIYTAVSWTAQPQYRVGLYNTTPGAVGAEGESQKGFYVPNQGPLVWCLGNLFDVSTNGREFYYYPMQSNQYPPGWYAIVLEPYPATNKQWSQVGDTLSWGESPAAASTAQYYAQYIDEAGIAPKNWVTGFGTALQSAFSLVTITTDVTSSFKQSNNARPGTQIKCPVSDYDGSAWWPFYYRHAPYLQDWAAYEEYGKYEGTYKDSSIQTQDALIKMGTQYLNSYSSPTTTISLSAADLYELDPEKNWAEELELGGAVTVIDDVMGLQVECIITKIGKNDLTQPHQVDTLTLDNIHMSAQKMFAQLAKTHQTTAKYQQGTTVETPFNIQTLADSSNQAVLEFQIRGMTQVMQGVKVSVNTSPYQQAGSSGVTNTEYDGAFTLKVDGKWITK